MTDVRPDPGPPAGPLPEVHPSVRRPAANREVVVGTECVTPVKVWQPWIRLLHWTLVGTVVVLSLTGFYIADPVVLGGDGGGLMATVRFVHVLAGWLLITVLVGRLYLAFAGNPWARWPQLLPVWRERRAQLWHTVRYYAFLEKHPAEVVGHNPMAGLAYVGLFGMLAVQALTGIALVAVTDRDGWEWTATGWLFQVLAVPEVRLLHHLVMWFTWTFVVFHVYAATLVDRVERGGEISSMVGGWKMMPTGRIEEELSRDAARRRRRRR